MTNVNTATPVLSYVHTDHLGRPIRMTSAAKATVWQASYTPFGEVQSLSGTIEQNLRFPGQYFLIEGGLAYNWHRLYDASTGRYIQPDPLRFVDGPSVYAYAGGSPFMATDAEGLASAPTAVLPPQLRIGATAGRVFAQICVRIQSCARALGPPSKYVVDGVKSLASQAAAMIAGDEKDEAEQAAEDAQDQAGNDQCTQDDPEGDKPTRVTNPKHHPNSKSPEPANVQDLFDSSVEDEDGVRWSIDKDGNLHRFSAPSNGQTHWNGSTAGSRPILQQNIPNYIKKYYNW